MKKQIIETESKAVGGKTWEELLKLPPSWFSEDELNLVYDLITLLIKMKKLEHDASFSQGLYCTDVPEKLTTENKNTLLFKL